MDSIIGLLFVLVPVVLSLIGKKLETSGKGGAQVPPRPVVVPAPASDAAPASRQKSNQKPKEVAGEGVRSIRKQSRPEPAVVQQEQKSNKEKIDPKKLVIYSELMKPKF